MSTRLVVVGWIAGLSCCLAADPSVTNVRAAQRAGTPYVEVTYDLAAKEAYSMMVTMEVSTNGGAAYFTPLTGLSGNTGLGVFKGTSKKVVWNAGVALPAKLYSNVRVQVTASYGAKPSGMVAIPAGTNSGTNPLGTGAGEWYYDRYPKTYSLTVEAFYIDETEVTKAKWDSVYTWAVANGYSFDNNLRGEGTHGRGKAANYPVHTVNWCDCVKWCNARSQKDGRTPCYTVGGAIYKTGSYELRNSSVVACNFAANGYRLPTNTEWEYAARGGLSGRRFPWGDMIDHSWANYQTYYWNDGTHFYYDTGYPGYDTLYSTGDWISTYTSPVGSFAANGYGLYDMSGNISEWCNDLDPSGWYRSVRGGSWCDTAFDARCGCIYGENSAEAWCAVGLRSVCR